MVVQISDEFDLEKIVYSGQCFRPRKLNNGAFLFISADEFVEVSQIDANTLQVNCDEEKWNTFWKEYFDLNFNYSAVRTQIDVEDTFMVKSGIAGEGIRILRQNKWEMIISYIISQRKSIPAIRTAVEKICEKYGAVFIMGIGGKLADGEAHDLRAPDYDDWTTDNEEGFKGLNGDLLVWYPVLGRSIELSSMGIRVDEKALVRQLQLTGKEDRKELYFHKRLIEGSLPLTIGGGIGQSRLCMVLLHKAHIGETQSSIWPAEMRKQCKELGMTLI